DPTLVAALNSAKKELADRKPALEKIIKEISEEIASLEKHRAEKKKELENDQSATKMVIDTLPQGCTALGIRQAT
ncbi:MAG: hypothetical protein RIQ81_1792, partial [Pseudomonadota bacterium]